MAISRKDEKEIMAKMKQVNREALVPRECEVEGCVALELRQLGICEHHHLERLAEIKKEEEKQQKEIEKKRKVLERQQKKLKPMALPKGLEEQSHRHFLANQHCFRCGQYVPNIVAGTARLRKIQPAHPSNLCKRFETVCLRCHDEGF